MTRPGEVEAVEAVDALDSKGCFSECWAVPEPADIVAAAYPVIAAAVREQVTQEIEAEADREKDALPPRWPGDTFWEGVTSGKRRAAVIARGES